MGSLNSFSAEGRARSARSIVWIFCAALLAYGAWSVPHYWMQWRHGPPDRYLNEHRNLFLGAVRSVAFAVLIPIPLLVGRFAAPGRRVVRRALWSLWAVSMAVIVATFAYEWWAYFS